MTLPLSEFVQGHSPPYQKQHVNPSESSWRLGENCSVSSLVATPTLQDTLLLTSSLNYCSSSGGAHHTCKQTQWRSGDSRGIALGSPLLQRQTHDAQVARQRRNIDYSAVDNTNTNTNTNTTNTNNHSQWRCGDTRSTPLGSSELETLVEQHRTQVNSNPRTMGIRVKQLESSMNTLNKTLAVVGSPELQSRITKQRRTSPSSTHLRPSKSSPVLPLGSIDLQRRHRAQQQQKQQYALSGDSAATDYTLTQTFTKEFVVNHLDPTNQMSWKDRAPSSFQEDNNHNHNHNHNHNQHTTHSFPPTNISTIVGRPEWIAGNQRRPPRTKKTTMLERSGDWSTNATRRANDRDWAAAAAAEGGGKGGRFPASSPSALSPSTLSPSALSPLQSSSSFKSLMLSPKREWRYGKRYFFHKAGRSMLRQAYL